MQRYRKRVNLDSDKREKIQGPERMADSRQREREIKRDGERKRNRE